MSRRSGRPEVATETAMRHVDIVPDWVTAVLAVFAVAGVFSIFGSFGVLVLGIVAATVWIAQTLEGY
jgi:hypothetical protein